MLNTLPTSLRIHVKVCPVPCEALGDLTPLLLSSSFPHTPSFCPHPPPATFRFLHAHLRAFVPAVTTLFSFQICAWLTPSLHSDLPLPAPEQGSFLTSPPPPVTVLSALVLLLSARVTLNCIYYIPTDHISLLSKCQLSGTKAVLFIVASPSAKTVPDADVSDEQVSDINTWLSPLEMRTPEGSLWTEDYNRDPKGLTNGVTWAGGTGH